MYYPIDKENGKLEEGLEYFQNILFVNNPTENRFDPMIIRYYPEGTTSNRGFNEINYQMIDEKWNGWIDLFTYDEHYMMGYYVDKGQLTHTRTMQNEMVNAKSSIGAENMDVRYSCDLVATDWYDGRTGNYLDTTYKQTCGGFGSYGGGS